LPFLFWFLAGKADPLQFFLITFSLNDFPLAIERTLLPRKEALPHFFCLRRNLRLALFCSISFLETTLSFSCAVPPLLPITPEISFCVFPDPGRLDWSLFFLIQLVTHLDSTVFLVSLSRFAYGFPVKSPQCQPPFPFSCSGRSPVRRGKTGVSPPLGIILDFQFFFRRKSTFSELYLALPLSGTR